METLARNGFNNMSLKQRLVKFRLKSNVEKQLPMVFYEKKGFLKNFGKLTGKHLWQSLFLNKVAGLWLGSGTGAFL